MKTLMKKASILIISVSVFAASVLPGAVPVLAADEDAIVITEEMAADDMMQPEGFETAEAEEAFLMEETEDVQDIEEMQEESETAEPEAEEPETAEPESEESEVAEPETEGSEAIDPVSEAEEPENEAFEIAEPENETDELFTNDPADELLFDEEDNTEEALIANANASYSGTIGTNLTWTLKDGVLTISGYGEMYTSCPVPWSAYKSAVTQIVIGNGVTSIGGYTFQYHTGVTKVTIGSSVTKIGYCAFYGCTGLTSVTLPSSLRTIGESVFSNCTALREVRLNNGLATIGTSAFHSCAIREISIPDTVTEIGILAFANCKNLTGISIPDSVTNLKNEAFRSCTSLKNATLGSGVTSNNGSVFNGCTALSTVTMSSGVTYIGGSAFRDCTSLKNISLSKNITTINSEAFYNCSSLTSLVLPEHLTTIYGYAFARCSSLKVISLPASLNQIGSSAFINTPLETVYFAGTQTDWNNMSIGSGNDTLINAGRIYGSMKLSAPKISVANVASSGKPRISWSKVNGASGYLIYRSASKNGTYKKIKTVSGVKYTDTTASANKTYYYKVKATAGNGINSSYSNTAGITCDCARPAISVKLNGNKKPVISWKSVSGAKSYTVYRATSKNGTYKAVKTLTGTKWTNTSVTKGKTYYYKVRANGSTSAANSAFSAVKAITVK